MDTSKNTDINIIKYKGYPSVFNTIHEKNWKTLHEGYRYENSLFEDSTSKYLQKNPNMTDMFPYLNKLMAHLINSVKYLRNFNNYAVRKDYKRIN